MGEILNKDVALEPKTFSELEALTDEIEKFFSYSGIITGYTASVVGNMDNLDHQDSQNIISDGWLKPFRIPRDSQKKAFYLQINSPDDVKGWNKVAIDKIEKLHTRLGQLIENNDSMLDADAKDKVKKLKLNVIRLKKALNVKAKSMTKECASVDDLREHARYAYSNLLKGKLIEPILEPIYEGMRQKQSQAYLLILRYINDFMADFGVVTFEVHAGQVNDYENNPYKPEEPTEAETTQNPSLKDVIKSVNTYAYVFYEEDDWQKCPCISEGSITLWRYKK